MHFKRRVYNL